MSPRALKRKHIFDIVYVAFDNQHDVKTANGSTVSRNLFEDKQKSINLNKF